MTASSNQSAFRILEFRTSSSSRSTSAHYRRSVDHASNFKLDVFVVFFSLTLTYIVMFLICESAMMADPGLMRPKGVMDMDNEIHAFLHPFIHAERRA